MYKLLLLFFCFLMGCISIPIKGNTEIKDSDKTIYKDNEIHIDITATLEVKNDPNPGNNLLIIKNKKTGKEWTLTYSEWNVLTKGYENWKIVTSQKPKISEISEKDGYIQIVFNYYVTKDDNKIISSKKEYSILSGKVLVPKRYLVSVDESKKNIYLGVMAGSLGYSVLITILLIILL